MPYIEIENFLAALHKRSPAVADALSLNRRVVEHGLLPVGLKLHLTGLDDAKRQVELIKFVMFLDELGGQKAILDQNSYRKPGFSACLVLPPLGSARNAIIFLECIENAVKYPLFNNEAVQIQVCSPGRLSNVHAGLLTLGFYLGSDVVRGYTLDDLETTFSRNWNLPRGRRITLYDGEGMLDQHFSWWSLRQKWNGTQRLKIRQILPYGYERTDILAATSRVDIQNINLLATLFLHKQKKWFWRYHGERFAHEMEALLEEHQFSGYEKVPWIRQSTAGDKDDTLFLTAIKDVMAYALAEATRLQYRGKGGGILYQMKDLLQRYRAELIHDSQNEEAKRARRRIM